MSALNPGHDGPGAPHHWLSHHESFAVWGLGASGVAAANLLARHGKRVVISDPRQESELVASIEALHADVEVVCGQGNVWQGAEVVVTSPGLRPSLPIFDEVREAGVPVISEIELAYDVSVAPFLCITGTDGKTTTTSLVGAILAEAGIEHVVAGNIGTPLCDVVESISEHGYIVAEVSAFQLWTIAHFHPHMAIFTNLADDHLDYFDGDYEAYERAKRQLIKHMDPAHDRLWVSGLDPVSSKWHEGFEGRGGRFALERAAILPELRDGGGPVACLDSGALVYLPEGFGNAQEEPIILASDVTRLGLRGRHNVMNMLAAAALCFELGVDTESIEQALCTFEGLPHRFEEVARVNGVRFTDDSKATNAHAALAGLRGADFEHLVVITGGVDKGIELSEFTAFLRDEAHAVILIGELTGRLEQELLASGMAPEKVRAVEGMEAAVALGFELAKKEGVLADVVLSPASSSFDMFRSYAHRGEVFQQAVRALCA